MTDVVIQTENLSGALTQRHQATKGLPDFLRAFVTWWFLSPAARQADYPGYRLEAVWALKAVSFREPARGI